MKHLGIDYGLKRIGLATSDGLLASPFLVIENKGPKKTLIRMEQIIKDGRFDIAVFGLPLDSEGGDTPMSGDIRTFAQSLSDKTGIAIIFINERYSSIEAEAHIREKLGIIKRDKVKELIDKMAAAMILQDYLERRAL